jgi:hypothetical protein
MEFHTSSPANGVLDVSLHLSYKSEIVPIENSHNIQIVIHEDTEVLDEVVVVGYATAANDYSGASAKSQSKRHESGVVVIL